MTERQEQIFNGDNVWKAIVTMAVPAMVSMVGPVFTLITEIRSYLRKESPSM